jgi:hypothetical protein
MFSNVVEMLFGCWHRNYSFPLSAKRANNHFPHAAHLTGTYVVCLDCGKEFPYDWDQMKVLSEKKERAETTPLAVAAAAHFEKIA